MPVFITPESSENEETPLTGTDNKNKATVENSNIPCDKIIGQSKETQKETSEDVIEIIDGNTDPRSVDASGQQVVEKSTFDRNEALRQVFKGGKFSKPKQNSSPGSTDPEWTPDKVVKSKKKSSAKKKKSPGKKVKKSKQFNLRLDADAFVTRCVTQLSPQWSI